MILPTAHYIGALRELVDVFRDDDRMSPREELFAEQARENLHGAADRLVELDALYSAVWNDDPIPMTFDGTTKEYLRTVRP